MQQDKEAPEPDVLRWQLIASTCLWALCLQTGTSLAVHPGSTQKTQHWGHAWSGREQLL